MYPRHEFCCGLLCIPFLIRLPLLLRQASLDEDAILLEGDEAVVLEGFMDHMLGSVIGISPPPEVAPVVVPERPSLQIPRLTTSFPQQRRGGPSARSSATPAPNFFSWCVGPPGNAGNLVRGASRECWEPCVWYRPGLCAVPCRFRNGFMG
jgi:hypothetical protein